MGLNHKRGRVLENRVVGRGSGGKCKAERAKG